MYEMPGYRSKWTFRIFIRPQLGARVSADYSLTTTRRYISPQARDSSGCGGRDSGLFSNDHPPCGRTWHTGVLLVALNGKTETMANSGRKSTETRNGNSMRYPRVAFGGWEGY